LLGKETDMTDATARTVVVSNAGVTRDNLIFRMTEDDWDTVMGVHLRGAFLVSEGAGYVSGQVIYATGGPRS
jgi:NAD(P)-dependent dehydrogenase (short-subunit alcohol dehydrogenase family)